MANKQIDQLNAATILSDTDDLVVSQGTTTGLTKKAALSIFKTWILGFVTIGPKGDKGDKGDTGDQGIQGIQGYPGTDGTNGVGVPGGGTSGQVLAKVDETDFNTHWVDETGTSGYTDRTFVPAIVFDAPFKSVYTQTTDITISMGASPVADVTGRITIIGDGVHALNFPAFDPTFATVNWYNANGQVFDNTCRNIIDFEFDGNAVRYWITKEATLDVTPPSLLSAVVANAAPTKIVLSYSELLDDTSVPATGAFSVNLGKAVTGVTVIGSVVTVTVDSAYVNTDVPTISYTPGGNPIQDLAHNHAASLTTHAITNNVLPAQTSISIVAANQIPKTAVQPANFAFGSGGGGGSDSAMSISAWVKWISGDGTFIGLGRISIPGTGFNIQIVGGSLYFQLFGSSGSSDQTYRNSNTNIVTNVWTHLVCTYDGSKLASGLKMYFNGALEASTAGTASYGGQVAFSADTVLSLLAFTDNSNRLNGTKMSSAYIWNKQLSGAEASQIYNSGNLVDPTLLPFAINLIGQYDLSGNLNDQATNHYDLTSSVSPTYSTDVP